MAIPWSSEQRRAVDAVLQRHPRDSGRCDEAAQAILPIAKQCDGNARILRIRPKGRARFVEPKLKPTMPWYEHHTTEVAVHCVDSLTGPDGTNVNAYLDTHWEHTDWLDVQAL
ncbi:hypothetical protein JRI60_02790 [Archangium violaceum]|uniref:hypothetical protein n=1 Tax=Archangium violaceum TaxID=83451 RepID=UPI00194DD22C|nr:hypothetical protein [Archangium violaceum]QRN98018.1 hypothetical protein JRI60_02790 [Archangium violaceum]